MSSRDAHETDRENARKALTLAQDAARADDPQKADAFTRIADGHIRLASLSRPE